MEETLEEIVTHKSFDSLVRAVDTEKEKKAGLQQTILKYVALLLTVINGCWEIFNLIGVCQLKKFVIVVKIYREEESRRLVKTLQRQLLEVKKEKESEIQVSQNFSLKCDTNCYIQTYLSVYLHVLHTVLSNFSVVMTRGIFLENQLLLKLVINFIILMTVTFDSRVIL